MHKPVLAVLAATVVVTLAPATASSAATPGPLSWGACPADVAKPGLECATLDVPLDYRDPNGRTIEIAVSRLASTNPEKHRGVLLTNTGGPGGAGLDFPAGLRGLGLPQEVLDSYDMIGMDPRGVGHSTPVTCDLTLGEHPTNLPMFARNSADVEQEAKRVAGVAEKCGSSATAPLLPHITTANTARDMDRIREALGESKVSYFGISYGTYLGSVYTTMFPDRSDRFLIDSATGSRGWDSSFARMFGRGVEDRFPDFAQFAAAHPEYGLGGTPAQVRAKYFELAARLDVKPGPDGYTGQAFRFVTFANLYFDRNLPQLAEIWRALDTGNPVPVPESAAAQQPPGAPADNYLASQLHVICNDSDWPESVRTYQRNVAMDRFRYPVEPASWSPDIARSTISPVVPNRPDQAVSLARWGSRPSATACEDNDRLGTGREEFSDELDGAVGCTRRIDGDAGCGVVQRVRWHALRKYPGPQAGGRVLSPLD